MIELTEGGWTEKRSMRNTCYKVKIGSRNENSEYRQKNKIKCAIENKAKET